MDKKVRGGSTHYESAKSALEVLKSDTVSPHFDESNASKSLGGMVRSLQEIPFKITLANFEMAKIGGSYLNKVEKSVVCLDSSGKFWQNDNKAGKNLLNSALVIPPLSDGLSPFPIFEMVSENNKTLDFIEMLQRAWAHMATALNNTPVKGPDVAITDLSFSNIHAFLEVLDKENLPSYLTKCYESMMAKSDFPFPTKVTICENHIIPFLLRSARERIDDKILADTCVAGLLLVMQAPSMGEALNVWKNLVICHVSKCVDKKARDFIKAASSDSSSTIEDIDEYEDMTDFSDTTPADEVARFGERKSLRTSSPFYTLFMRAINEVEQKNSSNESASNELYAPAFIKYAAKQFMSLFPLMSAVCLDGKLMNNAYVELHWRSLRAEMAAIPKAQQWPSVLIGHRHQQTRRQAGEIREHSLIPNLRFGGKARSSSKTSKHRKLMAELSGQSSESKVFRPTPTKRKSTSKVNESFEKSKEHWMPKVSKTVKKTENYMKGKVLDLNLASSLVQREV